MKRLSNAIESFEVTISSILMAAITLVLFANVIFRYFVKAPLFWANELSIFMFAWATFFGGSLGLKYGTQAAITFLQDKLAEKNQRILQIITYVIVLASLGFLVYISFDWIVNLTDTKSSALRIPMWIPYLSVPVGLTFAFIHMLDQFIDLFRKNKQGRESV